MTTVNPETGEIILQTTNRLLSIDDAKLLEDYAIAVDDELVASRRTGELKQEIHRRLEARGASKLYGDGLEYHDTTTKDYDRTRLGPILEQFTPAEKAKAVTPAHEETIQVEEKINMTQVKVGVKNHGLQEELEKLTFPGAARGKLVEAK